MSLAHLAVILLAALLGVGAAGLLWLIVERQPRRAARAEPPPVVGAPAPPPTQAELPPVPVFPDPTLSAQVAAIRAEMQKLAQTQADLVAGMARWENQLLAEMRAIAEAGDPEVLIQLARIATAVGAPDSAGSDPPMVTPEPADEGPPTEKASFIEIDVGAADGAGPKSRQSVGDDAQDLA